jgi:hypothetical protein
MKIGRGNRSTWRKPAPAPLCPLQIPFDQTRDRTQAAAVGSQQLTAWAMARPSARVSTHIMLDGMNMKLGQRRQEMHTESCWGNLLNVGYLEDWWDWTVSLRKCVDRTGDGSPWIGDRYWYWDFEPSDYRTREIEATTLLYGKEDSSIPTQLLAKDQAIFFTSNCPSFVKVCWVKFLCCRYITVC